MKHLPQISEAEYEVMKIVWKHAPISTNDVTKLLLSTSDWSPKTIQTLLKRLVQKKALTYEKESRFFVYSPLVLEEEYLEQQNHTFLNRFYNGNLAAMLNHFLDHEHLSEQERQELQEMLLKSEHKKEG